MHHRLSERIHAHVMLMILAANCARLVELRTGESIDVLRTRFDRIHAHQVTEYVRARWKCTELAETDLATAEHRYDERIQVHGYPQAESVNTYLLESAMDLDSQGALAFKPALQLAHGVTQLIG